MKKGSFVRPQWVSIISPATLSKLQGFVIALKEAPTIDTTRLQEVRMGPEGLATSPLSLSD
jgi:hypothetical protein